MRTVNPANHGLSCPTGVGSEYTAEEAELLRAVEAYRLRHGLRFMAVTDILKALWLVGYRKATPAEQRQDPTHNLPEEK